MLYVLNKNLWYNCRLCGQNIKDLAKIYGGSGVYYDEVFRKHLLNDHNLSDIEYFTKFVDQPKCPCGCGKFCLLNKKGYGNFKWKQPCGKNEGVVKWSEKAKIERCGSGNPAFGKTPWNKGLTKETSKTINMIAKKRTGQKMSDQSKIKMSESAKKRLVHGHTNCLHSEKSKELMRQKTLNRIHNGEFKQTKTKPHIEFTKILNELNIKFEEEKVLDVWSFDFYIPDINTYIEVDGDYFHSNPKIYPSGPKTNTQKINWYRDIKKNEFCKNNNIFLLRFWESDILSDQNNIKIRMKFICNLRK